MDSELIIGGSHLQTTLWAVILISFYAAMFIIVPPKKGPELSPFGFWLGLVQAVVILWLGQARLGLFRLVGDPTLLGIPILTALLWIPPVILFAYFFPHMNTLAKRVGYIVLFAAGATLFQYIAQRIGLWRSIRWNTPTTFLLAIGTHSLMTIALLWSRKRV